MGTVKTCGDAARIKTRDTDKHWFDDSDLLIFINGILTDIYQKLVFAESNLVYAQGTITTSAGTPEYTPSFSFTGFLEQGSWITDSEPLAQVFETRKIDYDVSNTTGRPEAYYITEDGKIGYLWVPDAAYTVNHLYWKPLVSLSSYSDDDLPWAGIFDNYIQRRLIAEMLEVMEKDNSRQFALAEIENDRAMNMAYARGVRRRRISSDMFIGI